MSRKKGRGRNDIRVTGGLDEVETGVNTVVYDLLAVNTVLLLQVGVETRLDVVQDGPPTGVTCQRGSRLTENFRTCHRC